MGYFLAALGGFFLGAVATVVTAVVMASKIESDNEIGNAGGEDNG